MIEYLKAGVPQDSVLGSVLYLLCTCDIPELEHDMIATFADDIAIRIVCKDHAEAVNIS